MLHRKIFSGERGLRGGRPPPDGRLPGGRPRPPPEPRPPDPRPLPDARPPELSLRKRRPGVLGFFGGTERGSLAARAPRALRPVEAERDLLDPDEAVDRRDVAVERDRLEAGRVEAREAPVRVPRCVGLVLLISSPGWGREPVCSGAQILGAAEASVTPGTE